MQKSDQDNREYRHITLPNRLECVLIKDDDIDISAASVVVQVGFYNDPKDYMGLAHFLEHMLFMGTKKYPEESFYQTFIKKNGGHSNAYTSTDHTNYYFTVLQIYPSITGFNQFFIQAHPVNDDIGNYPAIFIGIIYFHGDRFSENHLGSELFSTVPKIVPTFRTIDSIEPHFNRRSINQNGNGISIGNSNDLAGLG